MVVEKKLVLVYCDEVNKENSYGLRIFHVGGSTVYVEGINGIFKMTGVGYSGHAADRFGACDNLWSRPSGLQYALCGGACGRGMDCGISSMYVNITPGYGNWTIGACDYSSFNSGDIGCLLWGFGGSYDTKVGGGMYTQNDFVVTDRVSWFGACIIRS